MFGNTGSILSLSDSESDHREKPLNPRDGPWDYHNEVEEDGAQARQSPPTNYDDSMLTMNIMRKWTSIHRVMIRSFLTILMLVCIFFFSLSHADYIPAVQSDEDEDDQDKGAQDGGQDDDRSQDGSQT